MRKVGELSNGLILVEMTQEEWHALYLAEYPTDHRLAESEIATSQWAKEFCRHLWRCPLTFQSLHILEYLVGSLDRATWEKVKPGQHWPWGLDPQPHYASIARCLFEQDGHLMSFAEWADELPKRRAVLLQTRNVGWMRADEILRVVDSYVHKPV